jgi:hypothetical protein
LKKIWLFFAVILLAGIAGVKAQDAFELPETAVDSEAEKRTAEQILKDCTRVIPTDPVVLKGTMTVKRAVPRPWPRTPTR